MIHNDRKIYSALIKLKTKHNGRKHNTSRHFHTVDNEDNEADQGASHEEGVPKPN